jgi:hypothetical protein
MPDNSQQIRQHERDALVPRCGPDAPGVPIIWNASSGRTIKTTAPTPSIPAEIHTAFASSAPVPVTNASSASLSDRPADRFWTLEYRPSDCMGMGMSDCDRYAPEDRKCALPSAFRKLPVPVIVAESYAAAEIPIPTITAMSMDVGNFHFMDFIMDSPWHKVCHGFRRRA